MMDYLSQPWPWYVAGPIISAIMLLLIYFGKSFGMSANLRTMCAMGGGGKVSDFFAFDWRAQRWNLVLVLGAIVGGLISALFLSDDKGLLLAADTVASLEQMGFTQVGADFLPPEIFGPEALQSPRGLLILLAGGFLVGFGARYAGGCTSGHAISGLSDLQLPSLIAVIGFFLGGLLMTHFILPIIYS